MKQKLHDWVLDRLQNSIKNGYDPSTEDPEGIASEMIDYSLDEETRASFGIQDDDLLEKVAEEVRKWQISRT